uniref:Secreted protein n=1 Tax=Macrostomum lignano TaxID=282301 RepID=A0A1I8GHX6_9PLAT
KGVPAGLILRAEGRKHAAKRVEPLDIAVAAGVKRTTRQTTVDGAGQQGFGYRLGVDLAECRSLDVALKILLKIIKFTLRVSQSSANVAQLHSSLFVSTRHRVLEIAALQLHARALLKDASKVAGAFRRCYRAVELLQHCKVAQLLPCCVSPGSESTRHSFLVLHQRLNGFIEQILSHLQLRF